MTDERALSWQLFFPHDAVYDAAGAPSWLREANLTPSVSLSIDSEGEAGVTTAPGPVVRIAWGDSAVDEALQQSPESIVALNAAPSVLQLRGAGYSFARQFVALPSLQEPRWLLPADHGTLAAASAIVPRPQRSKARLQRAGMMILLKSGRLQTRSRLITIASKRLPAIVSLFERQFPGRTFDLAISTGTPGPMRKPTIACIDRHGTPLAFAKVATSPIAERLLHNEASLLRLVGSIPRLQGRAPRLLAETTCDGRIAIVQSALTGESAPRTLGPAHEGLLSDLQSPTRYLVSEHPFLRRLLERVQRQPEVSALCRPLLLSSVRTLAGLRLPSAVMHGDFAPWNLRMADETLVAFDWEYGAIDGLAGIDALHHLWQTCLLLDRSDVATVVRSLEDYARTSSLGLEPAQALALVSIYLVHGLAQRHELGNDAGDPLRRAYEQALQARTAHLRVLEEVAV